VFSPNVEIDPVICDRSTVNANQMRGFESALEKGGGFAFALKLKSFPSSKTNMDKSVKILINGSEWSRTGTVLRV
jgi:hypothetical protein